MERKYEEGEKGMYENLFDKSVDKELNIKTTGLIEWPRGVNLDYFRTESSSYGDLDRFIAEYDWREGSHLVDFGSGKGRIVFYFNHQKEISTTGIEVNEKAFSHLTNNLIAYREYFPKKAERITLLERKAEEYTIQPEDDLFYFFNPFTVNIFEKVVRNIEKSIEDYPRVADIILYYPNISYEYFLDKKTSFTPIQKIKNKKYFINNRECFVVYRYSPD